MAAAGALHQGGQAALLAEALGDGCAVRLPAVTVRAPGARHCGRHEDRRGARRPLLGGQPREERRARGRDPRLHGRAHELRQGQGGGDSGPADGDALPGAQHPGHPRHAHDDVRAQALPEPPAAAAGAVAEPPGGGLPHGVHAARGPSPTPLLRGGGGAGDSERSAPGQASVRRLRAAPRDAPGPALGGPGGAGLVLRAVAQPPLRLGPGLRTHRAGHDARAVLLHAGHAPGREEPAPPGRAGDEAAGRPGAAVADRRPQEARRQSLRQLGRAVARALLRQAPLAGHRAGPLPHAQPPGAGLRGHQPRRRSGAPARRLGLCPGVKGLERLGCGGGAAADGVNPRSPRPPPLSGPARQSFFPPQLGPR
mmetsp:Transcript_29938/g.93649  ORF Transcript_29938/g.93649 Transcript_29938/m.93649 type:complete len:367 (+) Transcript_29938:698-1798(+)